MMAFCITVRSDFVCLNSYILFCFLRESMDTDKDDPHGRYHELVI